MELKQFSSLLELAFDNVASGHGQHYQEGGARAWATTGASYLGFALCGFPVTELRRIQYRTRQEFGPVILDCKWYDTLKELCLEGHDTVDALLPGADGTFCRCSVSAELFLEMLDFCREG